MSIHSSQLFSFSIIFTGFKRAESWWNFKNVISPFYRLYYITAGKGRIYMHDQVHELTPGHLFLIPKLTIHSYECDHYMDHYYVCFFDNLDNSCGIPCPSRLLKQVNAQPYDLELIQRLQTLLPDRALLQVDPRQYDNDKHFFVRTAEECTNALHMKNQLETDGILMQFFSRFITPESLCRNTPDNAHERLDHITHYISTHLSENITIPELADQIFLSPDYFSKVFKRVFVLAPNIYIQLKRIERAEFLLLTSHLTIQEIASSVGIHNVAQFTRLFKKFAQCSPREYRVKQLSI